MRHSKIGLLARLTGPLPVVCIAAASAVAIVVGFGWSGSASPSFWRARQAAVDPPQLWSVEAVPQPAGWRPVRICTDLALRSGFTQPLPVQEGESCAPVGDPVRDVGRYAFRCVLGGRLRGVSSTVTGDLRRDFTTALSVTDLDAISLRGDWRAGAFQQVRRYRLLGPCPHDWDIGERTDRNGQRSRPAIVAQNGAALQ